ncbi:MAG: hypothetical protein RR755_06480 [Erysipelotrichaceae bacterium]
MSYILLIIIFVLLLFFNRKKSAALFKYCLFRKKGYQTLKKTISGYGYTYSLKEHLFLLFLMSFAILSASYLFQVKMESVIFLILLASTLCPIMMLWIVFNSYQEQQFSDITLFLQHFLAMFKLNPKTYQVLQDCQEVVGSEMKELIKEMLKKQESGGSIHETFLILLNKYPHFIIHNVTTFVEAVEKHGTDHYLDGLDIIQDDIDDWIEDVYLFKKQQMQAKNKMLVLCVFSCVISFFAKNMLSKIAFNQNSMIYQIAILFFFITVLITLLMAHKILGESWMDQEEFICRK